MYMVFTLDTPTVMSGQTLPDPNQKLQNAAFDQGLHCLPFSHHFLDRPPGSWTFIFIPHHCANGQILSIFDGVVCPPHIRIFVSSR